ncbi:MAG: hypothetical protein HKN67_11125 [Saprospiraceae bacterium]|nr:hypothetical protein [Saprospiraceae bacterium]
MKAGTLFVILVFISMSCRYREVGNNIETNYFSLDSLVDAQIAELIRLSPGLEKQAFLDSVTEQTILQLDSAGWENELKVFREANIDKPAFYGSYTVNMKKEDAYSNLLYDEYLASDSAKLSVKSLRIYYLEKKALIKKFEVVLNDKNELFESDRQLKMIFEDRESGSLLSSYHVKGSQRLKLNEVVTYEVSSNLVY